MEEKDVNIDFDNLDPFSGIVDLEDYGMDDLEDHIADEVFGASTLNPNKDDNRRLFQVRNTRFFWDPDPTVHHEEQRNPISLPTKFPFPDDFYQAEGGIVVIYWEKDRSVASTCSIKFVNEQKGTFIFRTYG